MAEQRLRRRIAIGAILIAAILCVTVMRDRLFVRSVVFRHAVTEGLFDGQPMAIVPAELRAGRGALGVFLVGHLGGYDVSIVNFFADVHEQIEVDSVLVRAPITGTAEVYPSPTWKPTDTSNGGTLFGGLRVAHITEEQHDQVMEARGDLVLELHLTVAGQRRIVSARLRRETTWWPRGFF
jgi:hypothetical protein